MEEVLDLYQKPYDKLRPVVCMDETCRTVAVDWQFTTPDARIKLKHLYPEIQA